MRGADAVKLGRVLARLGQSDRIGGKIKGRARLGQSLDNPCRNGRRINENLESGKLVETCAQRLRIVDRDLGPEMRDNTGQQFAMKRSTLASS